MKKKFILRRVVTSKQSLLVIADSWDDAKRMLKDESTKFNNDFIENSEETIGFVGDVKEDENENS